jgi:tRNA(Ile)-lysidine synthase
MRHVEFVGSEPDIPWLAGAVRDQPYLAAVSGGADSVAMLHILLDAGFTQLVVCHLDHRLRGRASTEDARFVMRMAARFGLPCEIGRVDVKAVMKERGESMETAARHARHRFFAECSRKHQCPRILLAHHAEDQAETILWNLLRGSHGLKGMSDEQVIFVQNTPITLIRPFLGVRRAALVAWLQEREIRWREDASNREPVALRNRLRNEVIPLMNEVSGRDSVAALVRAAGDFAELAGELSQSLDLPSLLDPAGRLHVPSLRKCSAGMQREALRQFLIAGGVASIDRRLLDQALGLLDHQRSAVINLPGGKRLRRREGRLWIAD